MSNISSNESGFPIQRRRVLGPGIKEYVIIAPDVSRASAAGQFIVLRLHEHGERIPLTIVETDTALGTVTVVVQEVGKTTREMGEQFKEGDRILDFVGPLGVRSEMGKFGTVVCVGGGLGIAPLYPIARDLAAHGNTVIGVIGARTRDLLIYEDKMNEVCDALHVLTDDGSYGEQGYTSDRLRKILEEGHHVDRVWAIGPPIMMKVCSEVTRAFGVKTTVSLNPIMVDGTGMCGGCRVRVGGHSRFACVHGPEFDGHAVDYDLLLTRLQAYREHEAAAARRYENRSSPSESHPTSC